MANVLILLFWIAFACIILSYLVYPIWIIYAPNSRKEPEVFTPEDARLPQVSIIFAAFNEEAVIQQKIESIFNTSYPPEKIELLVGNDNSTDQTEAIVLELCKKFPQLQLVNFTNRTGKSGIINTLMAHVRSEIVIATDANIIFTEQTIFELIKRFKAPKIQLVGGNIIYQTNKRDGIALQEEVYLNWENKIKQAESKRWWIALGVEGGCYAIRKSAFRQIPPLTFMEDFYITMAVLHQKGAVWFESAAVCYEDVSTQISEEFKRKVRISIGNWQNLNRFSGMIFKPLWPIGTAFFMHKVLRWFTPFFLVVLLGGAAVLAAPGNFYTGFAMACLAVILLLPLDFLLMKRNMHTGILRFINHFLMMNLALLVGFIKYSKGIKSNVWQPTKRNQ